MTRYLITPSLHNSWSWYLALENQEKAEFLKTLRKEPIEQNESMMKGIEFENDVVAYCNSGGFADGQPWAECVREVGDIVRGSLFQERVMQRVEWGGHSLLLYGKVDAMKADTLYDIKYTSNYEVGKFCDSIQHPLYMFCGGFKKFAYLITDGRSVWREDYAYSDSEFQRMKSEVVGMVNSFMRDHEMRDAFIAHWKSLDQKQAA